MLVTFLAPERNGGEMGGRRQQSGSGGGSAAMVVVEAEGTSGSDVDGRLSLSSANNIQHRPLYSPRRRRPSQTFLRMRGPQ